MPHPLGYNTDSFTEWARVQANGLLGTCGQFVCATTLEEATWACRTAAGSSPSALVVESSPAFVFYAGQTLPEQLSLSVSLNLAWNAAGQPCYGGLEDVQPPGPDAGPDAGTCADACDDGQGGTLQSVGEHCAGDDANPAPPGGTACCHGLTCEGATASEMGVCTGTLACPPAQPNWVGLDTGTLRNICTNTNVNGAASQSGIAFNRTCGLAFERWVLTTMGQAKRNDALFFSQQRQNKTGGLPASVIPEFVGPLSEWWLLPAGATDFSLSTFFEVKAVNGALTLGANQWQIYGLLNVAQISPAGKSAQTYPSPALIFTTTSNTTISPAVPPQASAWKVQLFQQIVQYDANGGTNPNLRITPPQMPLTPATPVGPRYGVDLDPWPHSPLTSPTAPLSNFQVPGDPDPDSATLVP